jgi:23S rRNA (uracil1939-C5)-methyltransferase
LAGVSGGLASVDNLVKAEVTALTHDGRGVARIEGKVVFLENALPGERVRFTRLSRRRYHDTGRAVEILEPSPHRVNPHCPHFGLCGGCVLQHFAPDAQRVERQRQLLDQLLHIGKVAPATILPPIAGPAYGYRRRARLGVRFVEKKGGVLLGFRERSRSYITNLDRCPVLHPRFAELLRPLRELVSRLSVPDRVPQIDLAAGDNATALVLRHLMPLTPDDIAQLRDFGAQHEMQIHTLANPPARKVVLYPDDPDPLYYRLPDQGISLFFEPTDFVQVNGPANEALVERVIELLAPIPQDRVLDLFCGLGNFTLPIARKAAFVTGIEGDASLVARARGNAEYNAVGNVEFLAEDLYAGEPCGQWWSASYDKLLLDPPRTGAMEIVKQVPRFGARRIVYVSCNSATLARDAEVLVHKHGYEMSAAGMADMFPQTGHFEAIAVFDRPQERRI